MGYSINYKGVYRTAPATQGLFAVTNDKQTQAKPGTALQTPFSFIK